MDAEGPETVDEHRIMHLFREARLRHGCGSMREALRWCIKNGYMQMVGRIVKRFELTSVGSEYADRLIERDREIDAHTTHVDGYA